MINLLKSDFYRLFRSRAFYICTLVSSIIFAAGAFLIRWSSQLIAKVQKLETVPELPFKSGISYGFTAFTNGNLPIFMSIFIAIFVTAEFVHGTMKNAVSKGFSKIMIYISKLITMTAATLIMILTMLILGLVSGTIVSGSFVAGGDDFLLLLRMVVIEILLHAALTSVFVMIGMIIKNNGGTIAVNIIGVSMLGPLIYQILDMLIDPKKSFALYGLQNNIVLFNLNLVRTSEDIIRAILVGIVFLAATAAAGLLVFRKADVK